MAEKAKNLNEVDFDRNHADAWKFFSQRFKLYSLASKAKQELEEYKCGLFSHHVD